MEHAPAKTPKDSKGYSGKSVVVERGFLQNLTRGLPNNTLNDVQQAYPVETFGHDPYNDRSHSFFRDPEYNEGELLLAVPQPNQAPQYVPIRHVPLHTNNNLGQRPKKKQKKAINRGKMGKRGRPTKERLVELFGVHRECNDRIRELERQLSSIREENRFLREELTAKDKEKPKPSAVKVFMDLLREMGIEVRRPAMRSALFLRAETLPMMQEVVANLNIMHNVPSHLRSARHGKHWQACARDVEDTLEEVSQKTRLSSLSKNFLQILGRNVFRHRSAHMLLWVNCHLDFAGATVICAYADGKFAACPRTWKQSFELRIMLERPRRDQPSSTERITVTFAMALLHGTKEEYYREFFETVKRYGFPEPPFLLTDFEVAIGNAARSVWPRITCRGCFFHYLSNLRLYCGRLKRWLKQEPRPSTYNLLIVSPFLHALPYYLDKHIAQLGLAGEALFKSIDFKLMMYVFSTYSIRYKNLFHADLISLRTRTNNTCEGRNSGVARTFAFRLSHRDFLDLIEVRFKHDTVRTWRAPPKETAYDRLLELVQHRSLNHSRELFAFFATSEKIREVSSARLLLKFQQEVNGRPYRITEDRMCNALSRLPQLAASFRVFQKDKKIQKARLQLAIRDMMREEGLAAGRKEQKEYRRFMDMSDDGEGSLHTQEQSLGSDSDSAVSDLEEDSAEGSKTSGRQSPMSIESDDENWQLEQYLGRHS
jgi:hypothetical protein